LLSVTLTGEHDLATLPIVDEAFQRIAEATIVIVDVRDATFIDSPIIGAIISQGRHAETLLVVPKRGGVRRALDLVGISSAVQVVESREEALRLIFPPGTADREVDLSVS
jgi:anti-anti-sigma regulatory factor